MTFDSNERLCLFLKFERLSNTGRFIVFYVENFDYRIIMESKKEHINVSVRIRPVLSQDSTTSSSLQIISTEPPVSVAFTP